MQRNTSGTLPGYLSLHQVGGRNTSGTLPGYLSLHQVGGWNTSGTLPGYLSLHQVGGRNTSGTLPGYLSLFDVFLSAVNTATFTTVISKENFMTSKLILKKGLLRYNLKTPIQTKIVVHIFL